MARIAGVDLPREKRVEIGLTYIYGIGLKEFSKDSISNRYKPRHKSKGSYRSRCK